MPQRFAPKPTMRHFIVGGFRRAAQRNPIVGRASRLNPPCGATIHLARSITSIAVIVDWAASMVKLILSPGLMPLSSDGGATG